MTANLARKNLYDYFSSQVTEVNERRKLELSMDLMRYLSALLVELSKTERAFSAAHPETLTEWHFLAGSSRPDKAAHLYKTLGDHALYVAGFFSESLERRPVGVEYYADMGGSAYHRAASLSTLSGHYLALSQIFHELSERFRACIGILTEVSESATQDRPQDLIRLYERWLTTQDEWTRERLVALGLIPKNPISVH